MLVLITAPDKIAGDPDIEDAVPPIGHDVNKAASHTEI
jgi:hypothetical protein